MKKSIYTAALGTLLSCALSFNCTGAYAVQQFKVGDRVEVDQNMNTAGYPDVTWTPGVIRKVEGGIYWIELKGKPPDYLFPVNVNGNSWTRAPQGAAAQNAEQIGAAGAGTADDGIGGGTITNPRFKIGERIDVDPNMNSSAWHGETIWKSGTIKRISDGAYWVELDEKLGLPPVPIGIQPKQWARPARNAAPVQPAHPQQGQRNQQQLTNQPQQGQRNQQQLTNQPHQGQVKQDPKTTISAHHGPHVPTLDHIKQMIIDKEGYGPSLEFQIVNFDFKDVQISPATTPPDQNPTTIGRLRMDGKQVHPVRAKFTVFVSTTAGDVKHFYEYDKNYYWLIDSRGECTLAHVGGGFKRIY